MKTMSTLQTFVRNRRGATAAEFAMIAMMFILLVMGSIELSRAFWIQNTLQYATEETARYAMVRQIATDETLIEYTQNITSNASVSNVNVDVQREYINDISYVTIRASYDLSFLTSLMPEGLMSLSGSARVPLLE